MNHHNRNIAAMAIAVGLCLQSPITNADVDVDAWVENIQAESDINRLARLYLDIGIQISPPSGGSLGIHGTAENPSAYDDHLADVSPAGWEARYSIEIAFRDRLLARNRCIEIIARRPDRPTHSVERGEIFDS